MWRLRVSCVPEDHKIKEENGVHPLGKKMGRRPPGFNCPQKRRQLPGDIAKIHRRAH